MTPSADPGYPPDPPDPVHRLLLGTSPTHARDQDDMSSKQTPSNKYTTHLENFMKYIYILLHTEIYCTSKSLDDKDPPNTPNPDHTSENMDPKYTPDKHSPSQCTESRVTLHL